MTTQREDAGRSPANAAWAELTARLSETGEQIRAMLPYSGAPDDEAELDRLLAMTFAQAYFMNYHGKTDYPEWLPFIGQLIPSGAINPDTLYYSAYVVPEGVYRIKGNRGTCRMLDFNLGMRQVGSDGHSGARTGSINGDDLILDADGNFDFILSKERPADAADWRELPPETTSLLMRQVSYDWENEKDAVVSIERLDLSIMRPRPSAEETRRHLNRLPDHMRIYQEQFMRYKAQVRDLGPANTLHTRIRHEKGGAGTGGGLGGQVIYHGNFELAEDEGLIVETAIPSECFYWNIQVTDRLHLALDPLFHQTSLNGHQARVDSDGKFRAVISSRDPGVPNWLDTAGYNSGGIIGRWTRSNGAPVPETKVVKLADLGKYLPADTPKVSPEEREERQRARCRSMQRRRR